MIILGIETSCDETACAILQKEGDRVTILSNIVASSASLQTKYGGIIPEQAAREQLKSIIPVIEEALRQAFSNVIPANAGIQKTDYLWIPDQVRDDKGRIPPIDAIAVTYGPGLIGSLLVGVETAKVLATIWNKPLIPVNHLVGHFYANWIDTESRVKNQESSDEKSKLSTLATSHLPQFPCIGLLVSGGHTDLVLFKDHGSYEYLGGTRDDAAGECFDKCARLLNLPYPGGPQISALAKTGNSSKYQLPRPLIHSKDYDFSFSGLKTAVVNLVNNYSVIPDRLGGGIQKIESRSELDLGGCREDKEKANICASIEQAIIDVLVTKTIRAAQEYKVEQIIVAGGVAANQKLREQLLKSFNELPHVRISVPPPNLCTDNAAMIASAAFFQKEVCNPLKIQADPNLELFEPISHNTAGA